MYVKIVEHLDGEGVFPRTGSGGLVVPTRNHIYETDNVEYQKIRITSQKAFDSACVIAPEYTFIGSCGDVCNCNLNGGKRDACNICNGEELPGFELIVIGFYSNSTAVTSAWKYIIAAGCELYVMNEEGKTIDSIICH